MKSYAETGTVTILRARTYALDPQSARPETTAIVPPGDYPLYSDGFSRFWLMTGTLNMGGLRRMGDGMFLGTQGDVESEIEVKFPSRTYGPDEWQDLLNDPICLEGAEQRLRIRETVNAS